MNRNYFYEKENEYEYILYIIVFI